MTPLHHAAREGDALAVQFIVDAFYLAIKTLEDELIHAPPTAVGYKAVPDKIAAWSKSSTDLSLSNTQAVSIYMFSQKYKLFRPAKTTI